MQPDFAESLRGYALEALAYHQKQALEHAAQVKVLERFLEEYESLPQAAPPATPEPPAKVKRNPNVVSGVLKASYAIIMLHGQPMTRSQLYRSLVRNSIQVPAAADPVRNLGTLLWRSKQFVHVEGRGYWPADKQVPAQ